MARLADGNLLVAEITWSSSPFGPGLHYSLVQKLARLAVSGQGWANDADSATYRYVSAAGFLPEMHALAGSDPRIRLGELADLFRERPSAQ